MDATMEAVIRLYSSGVSIKQIAQRGICSAPKARKILITTGQYTTPAIAYANNLLAQGKTVADIALTMGITTGAVSSMLPYTKCLYGAEYPTINALRIRKCRAQKQYIGRASGPER